MSQSSGASSNGNVGAGSIVAIDTTCGICLEPWELESASSNSSSSTSSSSQSSSVIGHGPVCMVPCGHIFGHRCVVKALRTSNSRGTCPLCGPASGSSSRSNGISGSAAASSVSGPNQLPLQRVIVPLATPHQWAELAREELQDAAADLAGELMAARRISPESSAPSWSANADSGGSLSAQTRGASAVQASLRSVVESRDRLQRELEKVKAELQLLREERDALSLVARLPLASQRTNSTDPAVGPQGSQSVLNRAPRTMKVPSAPLSENSLAHHVPSGIIGTSSASETLAQRSSMFVRSVGAGTALCACGSEPSVFVAAKRGSSPTFGVARHSLRDPLSEPDWLQVRHTAPISSMLFADPSNLYTTGLDGNVHFSDIRSKNVVLRWPTVMTGGSSQGLTCCALKGSDGLLVGGASGSVLAFDIRLTTKPLFRREFDGRVLGIAYSVADDLYCAALSSGVVLDSVVEPDEHFGHWPSNEFAKSAAISVAPKRGFAASCLVSQTDNTRHILTQYSVNREAAEFMKLLGRAGFSNEGSGLVRGLTGDRVAVAVGSAATVCSPGSNRVEINASSKGPIRDICLVHGNSAVAVLSAQELSVTATTY